MVPRAFFVIYILTMRMKDSRAQTVLPLHNTKFYASNKKLGNADSAAFLSNVQSKEIAW